MPLYGAIDLHSNNNYLVVIDEKDQVVLRRRGPNVLELVLQALEPFRSGLVGVAVESTYNWYWMVDGLMEARYRLHLVNTAAVRTYEGIKHTNDWTDAVWLAHLLRLGLLPEGYIYPAAQRPIRDLLRKRSQLVRQRTAQLLSLGNIMTRNTGVRVSRTQLKELTLEQVSERLSQPQVALSADCSLQVAGTLDKQIDRIEQEVGKQLKLDRAAHKTLQLLETAFVEAANYAALSYRQAQVFVERKTAQVNRALAIKALANKLCRASYWVMKEQVKFEPARLFGS